MSTTELVEVRCRGCRTLIGMGHGQPQQTLFCSTFCSTDYPALDNTERDDLIEYLVYFQAWAVTKVAREFDISRQRAHQIMRERGLLAA